MEHQQSPRLASLVAALEGCATDLDARRAAALLEQAELGWDDIAPYVEEKATGYSRRRVARGEGFEMLVMTWRPGQASVPHDHASSSCTMRVFRGRVAEVHFRLASDGLVDAEATEHAQAGDVVLDPGEAIHLLTNEADATETLVTLHIYAPPLPELRRYAARPIGTRPAAVFTRSRHAGAPSVAVVGGGFSGTMVASQLLRRATERRQPLHVVLLDRHSSFGEGPAYRTADLRHLLNVPAANMSAWPDRPDDFFAWAQQRDAGCEAGEFLPRRLYGEYVRDTFFAAAAAAGPGITMEVRQEEVSQIAQQGAGWRLKTSQSTLGASAVVLATGHRPPDESFCGHWAGTRARLISDPWASLALTAIAPDEAVAILGTGLTAVDVLLTLGSERRQAPITAVSRRGLLPLGHATVPSLVSTLPQDVLSKVQAAVAELLASSEGPSTRQTLRAVRRLADQASAAGGDWRSVIDALRPHTGSLWRSLAPAEAVRWLRHVRPFWEVHRHRTAPHVTATVQSRLSDGSFGVVAGRVIAAHGSAAGVDLQIRRRGSQAMETLSVAWVVNCTGPGIDLRSRCDLAIASLIHAGHLQPDALGLGVLAGTRGAAVSATGRERNDLVVVGTLRKAQLWESTAVPELRHQAADAADCVLAHLEARTRQQAVAASV